MFCGVVSSAVSVLTWSELVINTTKSLNCEVVAIRCGTQNRNDRNGSRFSVSGSRVNQGGAGRKRKPKTEGEMDAYTLLQDQKDEFDYTYGEFMENPVAPWFSSMAMTRTARAGCLCIYAFDGWTRSAPRDPDLDPTRLWIRPGFDRQKFGIGFF